MTLQQRLAALTALLLAATAHAVPALLHPGAKVEIAGGTTELASYGSSFANIVAGVQSPDMVQDIPKTAQTATADMVEQPVNTPHQPLPKKAVQVPSRPDVTPIATPLLPPTKPPQKLQKPVEMVKAEQPPQQTLANKPTAQVQPNTKPDTLAPIPDPKPQPKPKPKPRGNGEQNSAQGTAAGQNSAPGGQADRNPGKAKVQGNAAANNYGGLVLRRINRRKRSTSIPGAARVAFKIRPDGAVANLRISNSSGSGKLDSLALAQVRRAAPFPPPPPGARTNFSVEIRGK